MRLVVLDRDGVINHDSPNFIRCVADWRPIEGSLAAIAALSRAGFTLAIATNQSGLARGLLDRATLDAIHRHMLREIAAAGGHIEHVAICPHHPDEGCACRKPRPGLIDEILAQVGTPAEGWMVGDRPSDLAAGAARGLAPILVRGGRQAVHAGDLPQDCLIVDDLGEAASILIDSASGRGSGGRVTGR